MKKKNFYNLDTKSIEHSHIFSPPS